MSIKPANLISESYTTLSKDFGYYFLRSLAGFFVLMLGLLLLLGIGIGFFIAAIAGSEVSTQNLVGMTAQEIASTITVQPWLPPVILLLGFIGLFFMYWITLGMVRDFALAIIDGKKEYRIFAPIQATINYLVAWILLMLPLIVVFAILTFTMKNELIVAIMIILSAFYLVYLMQFQILPVVAVYEKKNALATIARNFNMLNGQRVNFYLAILLLLLIAIPLSMIIGLIQFIPVIGQILAIPINLAFASYSYIWTINLYRQCLTKK